MPLHAHPGTHIEVFETEEGLYSAFCPELGIIRQGSTMKEAEAAVLRLIDERLIQIGLAGAPTSIQLELDTRLEPDEDELR